MPAKKRIHRPRPLSAVVVLAAVLALSLPVAATAQRQGRALFGPGGGPAAERWHGPDPRLLAAFLQLDETQKSQAKQLHDDLQNQLEPLRDQIRATRDELHSALTAESPDAANVGQLVLALNGLHEQVRQAVAASVAAFGNLLTPEQRDRFEIVREWWQLRRGRPKGPPPTGEE